MREGIAPAGVLKSGEKVSEPWGVRQSGEDEVSRYPAVFPLSLDK